MVEWLKALSVTTVFALMTSAAIAANPPTTLPSADELIQLAPKVTLNDPQFKTFHLKMTFSPSSPKGQVWDVYLEGNRFSFVFADPRDGTPYFLDVNGQLMLYEAVRQRVIVGPAKTSLLYLGLNAAKDFDFHWLFNTAPANCIEIDARSLLADQRWAVSRENDGTFTLSCVTKRGTHMAARFDRTKRCPMTRFDVLDGKQQLFLRLEMYADGKLPDYAWRAPQVKWFDAKVPVIKYSEWVEEGLPNRLRIIGSIMLYRAALDDKEARQMWESAYGNTDWQKAKAEDDKISPVVRQIVAEMRDKK